MLATQGIEVVMMPTIRVRSTLSIQVQKAFNAKAGIIKLDYIANRSIGRHLLIAARLLNTTHHGTDRTINSVYSMIVLVQRVSTFILRSISFREALWEARGHKEGSIPSPPTPCLGYIYRALGAPLLRLAGPHWTLLDNARALAMTEGNNKWAFYREFDPVNFCRPECQYHPLHQLHHWATAA